MDPPFAFNVATVALAAARRAARAIDRRSILLRAGMLDAIQIQNLPSCASLPDCQTTTNKQLRGQKATEGLPTLATCHPGFPMPPV